MNVRWQRRELFQQRSQWSVHGKKFCQFEPECLFLPSRRTIRDCLASLLDASVSDKKAAALALLSVIDGALTLRMLYGTSKEVRLVKLAEAVLKNFQ